jgi:hypothetical protein
MLGPKTWIVALAAVAGAACSPTLNWREFVPEGSGLTATFPCRPDRETRDVVLAGSSTSMTLLACSAGGATYALSFADVADPARITATLGALRTSAVANVQGVAPRVAPLRIKGMTANEQAARIAVSGRRPDGAALQEQAAFFTRGQRVYQATVIGAQPVPQSAETFFGGLKFPE